MTHYNTLHSINIFHNAILSNIITFQMPDEPNPPSFR